MLETILAHIVQPAIVGFVSICVALLGVRQQNNKNQEEIKRFFMSEISEIKASQQELNSEIQIVKINFENMKKSVEKHNSVIERTYELEKRMDVAEERQRVCNHRVEDLEKKV